MTRRSSDARRRNRLWSGGAVAVACLAVGALVATLVSPQHYANAETTAFSTIYETATNTVNGSVAASSDAPGGQKTGTAKPGDTLKWVVPYQNNTGEPASVDLKADMRQGAGGFSQGTYVPGSLQLPPNPNGVGALTPQWALDGAWSSGTPPANANGVGFVGTVIPQGTRQLSNAFPSPVSTVVSASGGDAYNVVVRNGLIYGVFHHRSGPIVYCAQMNGTTCPGWPTGSNAQFWSANVGTPIGFGIQFAGTSGWQGGTWISGNKLYWLMGLNDNSSAGTACLDLSVTPATSCGYTALVSNQTGNTSGGSIGGTALTASNGRLYLITVTNNTDTIVCVDPATGTSCGTLPLNSGVTSNSAVTSATFFNRVFTSVRVTNSSSWQTYCYVAGGSLCAGSWPVTTSTSASFGGTPFAPVLSTTGALTGVCTITNGGGTSSQCWDLSGAPLSTNPYSGTGANYSAAGNGAGDTYIVGTKVYGSAGNSVFCVDFASYSGTGIVANCAGFTRPANNINYTVRPASDVAPNCLVATGDAGVITFFNAITGGGCTGTSGPSTMTVTPQSYYCGSGAAGFSGWGTLSLPGLVNGTYTSASVTLRDQNSAVISGFNNITLNPGETRSLAAISTAVTAITATVTVNGVNDPSGVASGQIAITWQGSPPELCFQTIAPPVSCDAAAPLRVLGYANAVTTTASDSDSGTNGNHVGSGVTTNLPAFLVQADPSQCSLQITKTPSVASTRPGGTVAYTITVENTGTQAYDNASFSDDLTDVLQDATYNNNQAASSGTVSYTAPNLSWSGSLAAGATATITYSVTVKSPDSGDHSMVNTVVSPTTGSNCATGSSDAACTATVPVSDLTVTKDADAGSVQSPAEVGDVITYDFSATNTGQTTLTGVVITDAHPGLSALTYTWPSPANPGRLLPGQTVTATATYVLKQSDIDNGLVQNTATATGNPPTGPPLTTPQTGVDVPLTQGPDLVLTKDADASGVSVPAVAGEFIQYTFTATNTGNATFA
jgi:uncharacterized repeat protein (TIGR01451 family)